MQPAPLLVKIDDAARRVPVEPPANITTTRDAPPSAGPPPQPLDGRAAAPRRAPPGTGTGSPMALFLRCWTATRPRAAARAVSAERVRSRTAQNEIRVVLEVVLVVFACARLSGFVKLFLRAPAA